MESLESLNSKEIQRNLADDDCVELELPLSLIQHLTSEDCDLQLLCRVCLSTNNPQLFPLYFSKEDEPLPEMFTSFTAISVHADEGLPAQICESCRAQVVDCYEFKIKCLKADYTLRSLLKGEFEAKVNPNENIVISSEAAQNYAVKSEICEIKEEDYLNEDVQYLEDLSDIASEKDSLIVKRITKRNRKKMHSVLDPVYVEQDLPKSKKRSVNSKSEKKSKPHICHFCAKRFFSPTALKSHVDRIHGSADDPNACRQCKETFASEHDLKVHSVIHDEGPMWKCNKCDKEFTERGPLRRHVQRHMECKRHTCASCGKAFAELYALRRHTRVHTGERAEKRHACNLCDKLFSESSLLTVHLARHRGDRPCICATCGKSFPSARLLQSHHLVHSEHKPHACRYCDKRFRHESTRNTHHRTHTGERPYVCSMCGKTFIQNSNLTLHMRTHTGEKPYTCDTCGRKFTSSSTLKSHARSHTGERPYGCDVCGKRFARMDLSAHMSLHTGERPYACGVCERKFARAAGLREHSRVHTGERPFECAMCPQKFATTSHLSKHAKSHQTKKKKKAKQDVILLQQVDEPYILTENYVLAKNDVKTNNTEELKTVETYDDEYDKEITVDTEPLEVTEEIVVQDDSDVKSDFLVVDDTQSSNYQNETLCLSTNGVNYVNDVNYANDVNLVTVNEGEVSISSASSVHEGTTVKLYQLDQSLVQIHSVGGQVTISKITSKMTANF